MIITILIFIAILGVLVFVHELGHFLVAKKSGMKVEEFGFGFPPRIFGLQRIDGHFVIVWGHKEPRNSDHTVYSVNAIPLGGYVKILGENNEGESDPRSFINKPFLSRLLTLLAGVIMNIILAWLLISSGFMAGLPLAVDDLGTLPHGARVSNQHVLIVEVVPDSPAAKAGLLANDTIERIDGQRLTNTDDLKQYIDSNKGKAFVFEVRRLDTLRTFQVASLSQPPANQGPTGVALASVALVRYPWYTALWEGAKATWYQLTAIFQGLYVLMSHGQGLKSLGGPVKIAQLTGQAARLGFVYILQFSAFLSLNLAILNTLPFPALDGGRVLFLFIEKVRRKRNNQNVEQIANTAGFVFLLLLMVIITARDVSNLGGIVRIFHKLIGG